MKDQFGRELHLPWRRGIGNECHKIKDSQGRLVATVESPSDGTLIVESVNKLAEENHD